AELQFRLAWHGFPSGRLDGAFGPRTRAALRRFQRWARLTADARAGPRTLAALRRPPASSPRSLGWPVSLPASDRFGPRGARFHAGIDFPGPAGAPVVAAAAGLVVYAQEHPLGYGLLVTIDHGDGLRTRYAHLSHASVTVGMRVAAGTQIGFVGSTGASTGPHLHFEVRWRGAAIDPLGALRR
ncbi:MAG: peptidoglycan DD-metalloendopeptidase family protein, partial [Actinobacteria bacterium]|nr:peptidoglycan DD-metalloendopeptidase family protein [Actinomycetota bacterium]